MRLLALVLLAPMLAGCITEAEPVLRAEPYPEACGKVDCVTNGDHVLLPVDTEPDAVTYTTSGWIVHGLYEEDIHLDIVNVNDGSVERLWLPDGWDFSYPLVQPVTDGDTYWSMLWNATENEGHHAVLVFDVGANVAHVVALNTDNDLVYGHVDDGLLVRTDVGPRVVTPDGDLVDAPDWIPGRDDLTGVAQNGASRLIVTTDGWTLYHGDTVVGGNRTGGWLYGPQAVGDAFLLRWAIHCHSSCSPPLFLVDRHTGDQMEVLQHGDARTDGNDVYISDGSQALYKLDLATGDARVVGDSFWTLPWNWATDGQEAWVGWMSHEEFPAQLVGYDLYA